jgi:hypothetical protein
LPRAHAPRPHPPATLLALRLPVLSRPQAWAELDPDATNYIPAVQLASLLAELDPPLGVRGEDGGRGRLQGIIMRLDVPVHRGGRVGGIGAGAGRAGPAGRDAARAPADCSRFAPMLNLLLRHHHHPLPSTPQLHYIELIHALAGRVAGADLPPAAEAPLHESLRRRVQPPPPTPAVGPGERGPARPWDAAVGPRRTSSSGVSGSGGSSSSGASRRASRGGAGAAGPGGGTPRAAAGEPADAPPDSAAAAATAGEETAADDGGIEKYSVAHYYAALYVQAAIRGFLQRARGGGGGGGSGGARGGSTAGRSGGGGVLR